MTLNRIYKERQVRLNYYIAIVRNITNTVYYNQITFYNATMIVSWHTSDKIPDIIYLNAERHIFLIMSSLIECYVVKR